MQITLENQSIKLVPSNLKLENIKLIRSMNYSAYSQCYGASSIAQLAKNLPAMQETLVQFLGQEDSLGYPLQYSWASLVAQPML